MSLDYTQIPNYSKRKMFLDPAGPVTIQRYEEYAYPKIAQFLEAQTGSFWVPDEVSLTRDQVDFKNSNKTTRHLYTSNILRQTALDSEQGRLPVQIFTPVASVPELEALVLWWSSFEQIHSKSYSHIIKNIYNQPVEQFNAIHAIPEIVNMVAGIDKYYNALDLVNARKMLHRDFKARGVDKNILAALEVSEHEHVKAIYLALIASYGLEAIRFMVSFATSFAMVENRIFIGSGNIISLIAQDETLHTKWTAYIINQVIKDDPRFEQVANELRVEAYDMLMSVIAEEKEWAHYLFKEGSVIGVNEKSMCDHVDDIAQERLRDINIKYNAGIKTTVYPWFKKHFNTNKKQSALQETESVSYIISNMTSDVEYADLPEI